jgi:CheY-like chemotaxis protein/anti-sigma regulatory factor (Ser/Thr protein kinase)
MARTAVRGDPLRLKQIVMNLVGNAIKFTARGEVSISVEEGPVSDGRRTYRIEVTDTGIGVSQEMLGIIFHPFIQAESSTTRHYGGSGLGLAISRHLVRLMGGEISARSEPGRGSTFWFTVPLQCEQGDCSAELPRGEIAGKRVLVVDDNYANRRLLEHQLKQWSLVQRSAPDAASALELLDREKEAGRSFDVLVTDYQMPGIDGLMLARQVHGDYRYRTLPIIMLTTLGDRFTLDVRRQAGIRACLFKPVRAKHLESALRACIIPSTENGGEGGAGAFAVKAAVEAAVGAMEAKGLRVLVADDNLVSQKVVQGLLRKRQCQVDLVSNGLEALEQLRGTPYDLVFMDSQMPEMDGFDATRALRRAEREQAWGPRSRLWVVAVTASAMESDREQCMAAGMDDFLPKPIRPGDLDAVLDRARKILTARG